MTDDPKVIELRLRIEALRARAGTLAAGSGSFVMCEVRDDGSSWIGGIRFEAKRSARHPIPTLPGRRDFISGLRLALDHCSSPSREEVAREHGYAKNWVGELIRHLEGKKPRSSANPGLTIETVVMLMESLPHLRHQLEAGTVEWPSIVPFADYDSKRSGPQTERRINDQRRRRNG